MNESVWHAAWRLHAQTQGADISQDANIIWEDGTVTELQTTYPSKQVIHERETMYGAGNMNWVYRWDQDVWDRLWNVGEGWFRWSQPSRNMLEHQAPVIWHHHDRLYNVTLKDENGDVWIRFDRGEDGHGPVLYHSEPAPFNVADAHTYYNQLVAT